jgi:hypothetical protein
MLSDYGAALLGIPLFLALAWENRGRLGSVARSVFIGAIIPGTLWTWYHWTCFGSPFTTPMKFTNPGVVDPGPLFRVIGPANVWYELLLGPHRGILVTQPWVYVVIAAVLLVGRKEVRGISFIAIFGLVSLVWMNAGFSGWHGGASPGPRYLALIFPAFGFLAGAVYDRLGKFWKFALWATVGASVILRMLVYCDILYTMPDTDLWKYYVGSMMVHFFSKYAVSFVLFWTVMGLALFWQMRCLRFSNLREKGI